MRQNVNVETSDEQCGFDEGKWTHNPMCVVRTLIDSIRGTQKYIPMFFTTSKHWQCKTWEVMKVLEDIHTDGKNLRIIQNIYWKQKSSIKINTKGDKFQSIRKELRQGCVLSPNLFLSLQWKYYGSHYWHTWNKSSRTWHQ